MKKNTLFVFLLVSVVSSAQQDLSKLKFGDVSEKDFATKIYSLDSNASAVVILDKGSCELQGNNKGWFSVGIKHFKRAHILNKNGYDVANVSIPLYTSGNAEETLDKLKAVTYNLENGKVVQTKLDVKASVFEDKLDKRWKVKKFTFPNIKEGSIIEFEYTTVSDFIETPDPWQFQGDYPCLQSEYTFSVPSFFYYTFLSQGYLNYDENTRKEFLTSYHVTVPNGAEASDRLSVDANAVDYKWVIRNVPALKEESFTSTIRNHIQKIDFQLVEQRDPLRYHRYVDTWPHMTANLLQADYFGSQLDKENGWLKDVVNPVVTGVSDKTEKAKKIYEWVRDNFTCTDRHRLTMDQNLKTLIKSKSGTEAEINILLAAMLRYADINADPVLLSTRAHGFTYPIYPLMNQYDYVIVRSAIADKAYYLDASESHIGFGYLPLRCYNGAARVVNLNADAVRLDADSVAEVKSTTVFIVNDEKGKLVGSTNQMAGYYESLDIRDRIKAKGQEEFQKELQKNYGSETMISNFGVDSLTQYDQPVGIHFDFDFAGEKEDIMYLNPMMGEAKKDNPFKSAERKYPVEMPYAMDQTYTLQLEVPEGYVVDELPKSVVVKLNEEGDGLFEYRISQSGNNISFRSRIKISRAFFTQDEYEMLREFFNLIVKKHGEQIVFKKKN